jgi:hypothetical protein
MRYSFCRAIHLWLVENAVLPKNQRRSRRRYALLVECLAAILVKMTVQTLGSYSLVERPIMRLRDRKKLAPAAPAVVAAP